MKPSRISENQRQCLLSFKPNPDSPVWTADTQAMNALWKKGLTKPDPAYGGVNISDAMFRLTASGRVALFGRAK
jgi:hypothetical protein